MSIEEDEVRRAASVHLLVDPIQELHGGVRPALAERIEWLDRHPNDRSLD